MRKIFTKNPFHSKRRDLHKFRLLFFFYFYLETFVLRFFISSFYHLIRCIFEMTKEEDIKQNIVDQLNRDSRIDASSIKVTVDGHSVTLEGSVPTYISKRAAEDDAWVIEGVFSVLNDLRIKYPTPPELPTDEEIKE